MQIMTKEKPVTKLEDMKGLRMTCMSKPFADAVQALGANPITVPLPDIYMTLSRNSADSALFSLLASGSIKIQDIVKHITLVSLCKDIRFVGINKDLWDSFPPDIQKAIESTCCSEAWASRMSGVMDEGDISGKELCIIVPCRSSPPIIVGALSKRIYACGAHSIKEQRVSIIIKLP